MLVYTNKWQQRLLPWILLSLRLLIAPWLIIGPAALTDRAVLWLYVIAFVSDYLDGAAARYFRTVTPALRKADSTADTIFYLALATFVLRRHPEEFSRNALPLFLFLATTATWYALHSARWHRVAGFHTYSAKLLTICFLVWVMTLFGGWRTGNLLSAVLIFGTFSNLEGILITLLLKRDCVDVPTFFHAMRQRALSHPHSHDLRGNSSERDFVVHPVAKAVQRAEIDRGESPALVDLVHGP
jgi:phosphatidylglycerophosphate synthase